MECARCSFDNTSLPIDGIAAALAGCPDDYRVAFDTADPVLLGRRPGPGVWSAIEYTCHVRDMLLAQRERVVRVLVEDGPSFPPMHRDERAALCRYDSTAPAHALEELAMAARLLATVLSGLDEAGWARPLVYNWPVAEEHSLAWMGRHTVHECRHHLYDIAEGLALS